MGQISTLHPVYEFVKAAIKNPAEVCTVFPTSKYLAKRLLDQVDFEKSSRIIEVGAGTGAITEPLLQRLHHPSIQYLGVEIVEPMVDFLKAAYPQAHFIQGSVQGLEHFINEQKADVVVSSLPWTIFDSQEQYQGVRSIYRSLNEGGVFVTYMCLNSSWYPQARNLKKLLGQFFSKVEKTPVEWRNMPPAFVLKATK